MHCAPGFSSSAPSIAMDTAMIGSTLRTARALVDVCSPGDLGFSAPAWAISNQTAIIEHTVLSLTPGTRTIRASLSLGNSDLWITVYAFFSRWRRRGKSQQWITVYASLPGRGPVESLNNSSTVPGSGIVSRRGVRANNKSPLTILVSLNGDSFRCRIRRGHPSGIPRARFTLAVPGPMGSRRA